MPLPTAEQIAGIYSDATQHYGAQRIAAGAIHSPVLEAEIHAVGMQAVAELAASMASPTTEDDPRVKRLMRQARQIDHARNHCDPQFRHTVVPVLDAQWSIASAVARLGFDPAAWSVYAEALINANAELLASLVSQQVTSLPPAEHDHD
jgi:hypothetical protein